jgi:hypothetical protein
VYTEIMASDPLCTIVWEQSELAYKVAFRGTCTLNRGTSEDFGIRVSGDSYVQVFSTMVQ